MFISSMQLRCYDFVCDSVSKANNITASVMLNDAGYLFIAADGI